MYTALSPFRNFFFLQVMRARDSRWFRLLLLSYIFHAHFFFIFYFFRRFFFRVFIFGIHAMLYTETNKCERFRFLGMCLSILKRTHTINTTKHRYTHRHI